MSGAFLQPLFCPSVSAVRALISWVLWACPIVLPLFLQPFALFQSVALLSGLPD